MEDFSGFLCLFTFLCVLNFISGVEIVNVESEVTKECYGTHVGFGMSGNQDDHYESLRRRFKDCTHVEGNLEITHVDKAINSSYDISFLSSIKVVTGYVLLGLLEVQTIPLINLRLIRADSTYNIMEISKGKVFFAQNPHLCYIDTIDWGSIVPDNEGPVKYGELAYSENCEKKCDTECEVDGVNRCWGESRFMCQTVRSSHCHSSCPGRCYDSYILGCCHPECAIGCYGPSDSDYATIDMSSLEKNRCAKCSMVVLEVFPMIMQNLMAHTGTQAKTLYTAIMRNAPFRRNLNKSELDMVDTLQTDEYTKIDVSLSYKIIVNFFQLSIPPPSRQWGAKPIDTEIGIGEDIERIRRERNSFVHRVNANISEALFDNFFVTFIEVGERIDVYLNKPPNNRYTQTIEQYRTCVLDLETEKKLLEARADIEQLEDLEESYTKLKIIVHEVDDSEEVVKLINSLKEDLNSENIKCKGAEKGSIILFIDVKNRVVLDDGLFQSEVSTFIQNLFKFCNLKCYFNTQTYAVIASAAEEFEEPIIYMPEKATGTSSMGDKGHVVVNFEVKKKIFHSNDSLNRTLNEVFNTIVLKGNGKNLLGKTDVYAELVKSENTTTAAFIQAQTPVKYKLPVSVTLRQQLNIKKSKNENPMITSCIKIGNTLVFTDHSNKQLIICNSDGTDIHHIPLSYQPYYITEIDSNTVAVSCSYRTILIINISTRSVTSTIKTSADCWNII
ncbi:ERBB4 [Mytilus edulis]|uniref:ERBB4 n=1 Tax=Mytilus edulis TaxID=6550 RepID=A0A8S3U1F7_MYTED|nr:ERBB4 [Mytilus edulis]